MMKTSDLNYFWTHSPMGNNVQLVAQTAKIHIFGGCQSSKNKFYLLVFHISSPAVQSITVQSPHNT